VQSPPNVSPGTVIADKYRVEKVIGRGGFGIVVRATHLQLAQPVAIKVLTEGGGTPADQQEDAARFRREAKATAAMNSEHVVRVLDADVLQGAPYIVMEYLEGETLHEAVYGKGELSIADGVDVAIQVLAALGEAHRCGIVHRDLKPANVFLTQGKDGTVVKVLDFGVSKLGASTHITKTGTMVGTVAYVSPEQLMDAKRVDPRADLWSLALVLYESLTKKLPFGGGKASNMVSAILTQPPVPLSRVREDAPAGLVAAIDRALAKDPDDRFANAAEMAEALAPFASTRANAALDALARLPRAPVKKKRSRAVVRILLAVALAVALAALAFVVFFGKRP
jgi:serine/threonine-protein kinase